ncbi:MAG TPA: fibronectin type III domain-containing protein, partial [Acidimicrobiales bacterium]
KTGYTFTGWNTLANGTGASYADGASYPFTSSTTLYAQWSINSYSVTYSLGGGTGITLPTQTSVATGLTFSVYAGTNPTRVGYTFRGWSDGTNTYSDGAMYTMGTTDVTLTAVWTAPLAVAAAPSISQTSVTSITVSFTPDANATSSMITLYDATTATSVTFSASGATASHLFTGLTQGNTYYASITSVGDGVSWFTSAESAHSGNVTLSLGSQVISVVPSVTSTTWFDFVTGLPTAVTLASSGSSGDGTISYGLDDGTVHGNVSSIVCSLVDGTLTVSGQGICYVYASIASDSGYEAATSSDVAVTFIIVGLSTPAAPSITKSGTSVTVTYNADPNAASTTITLYNETTGTSVTVTDANTGSYTFTGLTPADTYYATTTSIGDGVNYTSSTEGAASATVTLATVALSTPSAPTITNSGTSVTVTYNADPNVASSTITLHNETTGTSVTYADANSGSHTFTGLTPADTYYATITSIGDGTHYTSSAEGVVSASVTLDSALVDPGLSFTNDSNWAFDVTYLGSGQDSANVGEAYTAVAVSASPGVITYAASGCTVDPSSGAVTFTGAGSCVITASITASGGYATSSATLIISVTDSGGGSNQVFNQITFSTPPASPVVGGSYNINASAASGGTVTLTLDTTSSGCTLSGNTVTFTSLGTCVIDAIAVSTSQYLVGTGTQSVVVASLAAQSITFTSTPPATPIVGSSYTVSATAPGGAVTFSLDSSSQGCSLSGSTVTFNAAGTCVVDASVAASGSYGAATSSQRFSIAIKYTVVYNSGGGIVSPPQATFTSGGASSPLTLPTPTRSGYTFVGWYTAPQGGTEVGVAGAAYTPSGLVPTLSIYAVWTPNTFSVIFNSEGGTVGTASATYVSGQPALSLPTPTKSGFTFAGWYTAPTLGTLVGNAGASYIPSTTATLYAYWTLSPVVDTVNFNNNGGTGFAYSVIGNDGTSIVVPGVGTMLPPLGYGTFAGWSTSPGTHNSVNVNANSSYLLSGAVGTVGSNITMYAVWLPSATGGAPIFTSSFQPTFAYGVGGAQSVVVTGSGTLILSVSTLPVGVSFVDNGGGNGTLTLNPTYALPGIYTIVFTANNAVGSNTQIYTFTVTSPYAPTNVLATNDLANSNSAIVKWDAPAIGAVNSYTILPINATTGVVGTPITGVSTSTNCAGVIGLCLDVSGLIGGDTYDFVVTASFDSGGASSSATSNDALPTAVAPSGSTGSSATGDSSNSQGGSSTASLGTSGSVGSISATAYGQGSVSVGVYNSNPAAGVFSVAGGTDSFDVSISAGSQFASLSFEVCGSGTSGVVDWYDSLNRVSYPVSPAPVPVSGSPGCYTVNLSPTSMPSVSNASLYGSIFYVPATSSSVVPPGAPTNVTAVAGNTSATVTWVGPSSNGSAPITGYTVIANPGGATCSVNGPTATSCVVSGLVNGTTYTFTVVASAGTSTSAGESNSVTPEVSSAPPVAPGTPTNVTAVAGNTSATVTWVDPSSNGGAPITNYTVTSSPGGATCTDNSAIATSCTVTGLMDGTTYTFTVVATNSAGTSASSGASNAVMPAASPGAPGAPTNVTAVAGNTSATVTWVDPSTNGGTLITSYTVTSSPDGATCTVSSATATSCTVTGLTDGTTYTFTVVATNSAGTSATGDASNSATPAKVVKKPKSVTLTASNFASGSSTLTKTMKSKLAKFAATIIRDGFNSITVTGFTDSQGTSAVNLSIGLLRASAVANYLRQQLNTLSYKTTVTVHVKTMGAKDPVKWNATPAGRAANRRVVVIAS